MFDHVLIAGARLLSGAVAFRHGFEFEPYAPRIYYANHSSHLDTLVLLGLIPDSQRRRVHPAAAKDYWWKTRLRRYIAERALNAVPVVRQMESHAEHPLRELEAALDRGDSLILFPEGTRGAGECIQPFKNGLHHLAAKHPSVSLVPVYIRNLNRVMPKGEWLPVPILCTVHFGAPFTVEPFPSRAEFLSHAQAQLEALSHQ